MEEWRIQSSIDGTLQPSLFFHPGTPGPVPLVVGLHTWSYDRFNQEANYLPLCRRFGWALLLPDFRGANLVSNPHPAEACASEAARGDVIDAVQYAQNHFPIDRSRIFLLGCSGGGHMALMTAAHAPDLFRAVDVWCPVTDLVRWYDYHASGNSHYCADLRACLGGTPREALDRYRDRSPVSHLEKLRKLTLSIHHGKHDAVVPSSHSFDLALALEKESPEHFFFDFFDGGHEQFPMHSFEWFARLSGASDRAVAITG